MTVGTTTAKETVAGRTRAEGTATSKGTPHGTTATPPVVGEATPPVGEHGRAGRRSLTRTERAAARTEERARRHRIAHQVASPHAGVARICDLLAAGLTRGQIRHEIEAGVWRKVGIHTLDIDGGDPARQALWWRALWESGSRSVLDGITALQAAGLEGWAEATVHVSLPNNCRAPSLHGVRAHLVRDIGPSITTGLRRTRPAGAAIRAAQWAVSDRQAATILAMAVQQRLVATQDLLARWRTIGYSPRRAFLDLIIRDLCDGAQALSELDFATACRARDSPSRLARPCVGT